MSTEGARKHLLDKHVYDPQVLDNFLSRHDTETLILMHNYCHRREESWTKEGEEHNHEGIKEDE